jgi:type II secretory pathway pseudopilin PulG
MRKLRSEQGFATLIELVIVVALIVTLSWVWLGRGGGGAGAGTGMAGGQPTAVAALEQAKGVVCRQNLQSIRQAIMMYRSNQEVNPPNLEALRSSGISPDLTKCEVGGEPYQYDPTTGQVRCVHPGHGQF